MTVDLFLQLLINGISIGLLYAVVALGLVLVLGVAGVFNFAHGDLYMLGAYALYAFYGLLHLNFFVSVLLGATLVALLGAFCNESIFKYMRGGVLQAAGATVGLGIIARQAVLQGFGTAAKGVKPALPGLLRMGNVILSMDRAALIGYSLLLMGILAWFLTKTKAGLALRAISIDGVAAQLQGINARRMYLLAMVLGFGLAGVAGAIVAPVYTLNSEMGHEMLFLILMVVILGGMQSPLGAVVGGLIIGLALSFGFHLIGGLSDIALFLLIGLILCFKPWGLFGRPIRI
jgi:branched-chain amino acid transport system permease protein